ncbi:MAG: hypothetical protein AAB368_01695, partial [bacterium]
GANQASVQRSITGPDAPGLWDGQAEGSLSRPLSLTRTLQAVPEGGLEERYTDRPTLGRGNFRTLYLAQLALRQRLTYAWDLDVVEEYRQAFGELDYPNFGIDRHRASAAATGRPRRDTTARVYSGVDLRPFQSESSRSVGNSFPTARDRVEPPTGEVTVGRRDPGQSLASAFPFGPGEAWAFGRYAYSVAALRTELWEEEVGYRFSDWSVVQRVAFSRFSPDVHTLTTGAGFWPTRKWRLDGEAQMRLARPARPDLPGAPDTRLSGWTLTLVRDLHCWELKFQGRRWNLGTPNAGGEAWVFLSLKAGQSRAGAPERRETEWDPWRAGR